MVRAIQRAPVALPSVAELFRSHSGAMDVARARLAGLFPAFSQVQRAALAEAMPALMQSLLSAQDKLILGICLEAEAWAGPIFTEEERGSIACVATSGWELEAYENAFLIAASRLSHDTEAGEDGDA